MKIKLILPILLIAIYSCKNNKNSEKSFNKEDKIIDPTSSHMEKTPDSILIWPHLEDTLKVKGKTIVILRPDSIRYNYYIDTGIDWISEIDSDLGFTITKAIDLFPDKSVKNIITTKRFIEVSGCRDCPQLLDRDTLDYGLILTNPEKGIYYDDTNIFGTGTFLKLFNEYYTN